MADLSKLVLPVKDTTTGEIENQEFNLAGGGGGDEIYLEQNVILSTHSNTAVSFEDARITEDSVIDVYTTVETLQFITMAIANGSCTIIFPQRESALNISVRIYIR